MSRADPDAGSPSPRLIATDLDGTLLRDDGTISERSRAALAAAVAGGAVHIVVTGRAVPWTAYILDDLGYRGLAVCGQGAQLYHAGEHRLLTSVTLDRSLAQRALAQLEAATGPLALAVSRSALDGDVLVERDYQLRAKLARVHVNDRADLWQAPITKLYMQQNDLSDDELATAARDIVGDQVQIIVAGDGVVEMLPLGLNKATGLSLAARRLGLAPGDTLAFGDMPNDIAMFRWAAWGIAMENAHQELKAVADEVTASNQDDGIAVVLERLFPSGGAIPGDRITSRTTLGPPTPVPPIATPRRPG